MNSSIIYTSGLYCVVDRRRPGDISPAPCDLRRDRYTTSLIAVFRVIVAVRGSVRVHVKSVHRVVLSRTNKAFSPIRNCFLYNINMKPF
jgi:hypothetical protein